jgi:tetratricopeptide (TPR) repeat protein
LTCNAHFFLSLVVIKSSHVCWHVYGLLHRSDHSYNEAIKAYKQALRIDGDNIQILRDLSMLQIQMRDLEGFAETRHNLLNIKPNGKINWLAFALAKHLMGDLRGAIEIIDIYLGTLTEGSAELTRGFESSELALYKNTILAEIPNNDNEALENLFEIEGLIVDRSAWLIAKCKFHLKLGEYTYAKQATLYMFERGMTENYKIHSMYMCALLELEGPTCDESWNLPGTRTLATLIPLSDEQKQTVLKGYETEIFPIYGSSSTAVNRIPMNLVSGDNLRNSFDVFCRKQLVKGVPSLCLELSSFFLIEKKGRYVIAKDPVDIREHAAYKLLLELVDGYMTCLESNSKLLPGDDVEEPPSTTLWTWYLRASLHELAGEYSEGIALLDKCLEHTPTAVDVYELKARFLKAAGDMKAAVESLDHGRDLDRQDRYINNQTTKFMLQFGMEEEALQRISLFTKHEGNPEANLYDMQCSWYELELAACHANKEAWGKSLKKYCKSDAS